MARSFLLLHLFSYKQGRLQMDELTSDELDGPLQENELPWYSGLTDNQRRFVEIYCTNGMVGYKAVMDAGLTQDHLSAAVYSSRLLRNANVKAAKDRYLDEMSIATTEMIHRLSGMATGSVEVFTVLKEGKRVIDLTTPQAIANLYLIKEIDADGSIKLHDSKDALKLLLQIRGVVVKNHKHFGDEDLPPIKGVTTLTMDAETMKNFDDILKGKL